MQTEKMDTVEQVVAWLIEQATRQSSNRYSLRKHTRRDRCNATAASPCDYWKEEYTNYRDEVQDACCWGHPIEVWSLQRNGGSSWHGAPRHRVPAAIGEKLAETWKVNNYTEFVGYRSVKRLLKDLGADAGITAKIEAAKKAAEDASMARHLQQKIDRVDEFIAKNGTWLDSDVTVALQVQADALTQQLVTYD